MYNCKCRRSIIHR